MTIVSKSATIKGEIHGHQRELHCGKQHHVDGCRRDLVRRGASAPGDGQDDQTPR